MKFLGKNMFSNSTERNYKSMPWILLTLTVTLFSVSLPAWGVLKKRDRGAEVTELQKTLKNIGYYSNEITGIYDQTTFDVVKKFQTDKGLKVDGIVGSRTLIALKKFSENSQYQDITKSPTTAKKEETKVVEKKEKKDSTKVVTAKKEESTKSVNTNGMTLKKTISGKISPKSVVYSGKGLFFAQNMMYSHTITVYDREFNLVKTIPDRINLGKFGFSKFQGDYQGAPVEAAFSPDGKYAYISNYQMYGKGFNKPGSDRCSPSRKYDPSFLYRIDTKNLKVDQVIQVGAVPKYTAVSPDNHWVLVSNWCSWDLSIIDSQKSQEIKRVELGAYPRGIVVDKNSENAYIAVMGSSDIAKVNLKEFSVNWFKNVGNAPRHLNISPDSKYLYATLNGEGRIAKIDLNTGKVIDKVSTGSAPRSMVISDNGAYLYVVNYFSNTVSKVSTSDMKVVQTVNVNSSPIGITFDPQTKQVWVACYSGSIMVFQD
jgi:YVTN family beta-propeller protein